MNEISDDQIEKEEGRHSSLDLSNNRTGIFPNVVDGI